MVQMDKVMMVYENSGTVAANGIDLVIEDGEFVFLVGPSGSGKTTIIKLLTGEVRASDGEIFVNDFNMRTIKPRKMPQLRRTLGVIFQDFRLIDDKTVYENVAFAMRVVGASKKEIDERVPYVSLSVLRAEKSAFRRSFPAVSSSALLLPAPWSTAPASSLPTSLPATLTP